MKPVTILLASFTALVAASGDGAASSSTDMSNSSDMPMGAMSTSMDKSPDYTITALPAVASQPSCIFNCLIPIGLADSSGCNDVTENCACLSAPADALDFMTSCIATVCKSSTSAYAKSATSLYESYCNSVYGTAAVTSAFIAEESAAAASSTASGSGSPSVTGSSSGPANTGASASGSAASASSSAGAKSGAVKWTPSLFATTVVVGGLALMVAL